MMSLSIKENQVQQRLALLNNQKAEFEDKVSRLRPQTLDPDMVEEYAIQMLGHNAGVGVILLENDVRG